MQSKFKLSIVLIISMIISLVANIASANYVSQPPETEPPTYCNTTTCYVWEDPDLDGTYDWYPATPDSPKPQTYCSISGCYIYECSSQGNCSWNGYSTYTSASVCTLTGCYVYECLGSGSSRSCNWAFKERSPMDRVFYIEQ